MGIASLTLGIISIVLAFVPFIWILSIITAIISLVLGIIALVKKQHKGQSIAGIVLSAITIILVIITLQDISDTFSNTDTTTSTNINTGKQETISNEDLRKNIAIEGLGTTKNGDFAIKITNNNEIPVCFATVETIFKDKDNNFMKKANTDSSFFGVSAKSETIVFNNGYSEDFSSYPNYEFSFEFANIYDDFIYDNFEITANNTGKQISVQVKNNNDVALENITVNVVYYASGKVVGCETGYCQTTTSANGTAYINVDYPEDSRYREVKFDDYKTYLIQASKDY